jgi:hypothetical protein
MSETAKDSVLFVILDLAFTGSGSSQQLIDREERALSCYHYFLNVQLSINLLELSFALKINGHQPFCNTR